MDCLILKIFKLLVVIESILLVVMGYMIKYAAYFTVVILGIILLFYYASKRFDK